MARTSLTKVRVIKGTVGPYDVGETFTAETVLSDERLAHLLAIGAVDVVSTKALEAAAPEAGGYSAAEAAEIDSQAKAVIVAIGAAADKMGISAQIANLADVVSLADGPIADFIASAAETKTRAESTGARSKEIADDSVAGRSHIVRALGLLGVTYNDSLNSGSLASVLADAVDAAVRKQRAADVEAAVRATAAAKAPPAPSNEETKQG